MECSCSASGNYDNDDQIGYHEKQIKAAKQHICPECGKTIEKGEEFVFCSIMMVEAISNRKMCLDCYDISEKFFSNGYIFGCIHDTLFSYLNDNWMNDLPSNCISKLRPRAKAIVCDMLQEFQKE